MAAREDHRDNVPRQGPCLPSCDRQHDDWADCAHYSRLHQVNCGEKEWELLRRYAEFHELDAQLAKAFDPATLPALPPKLIINEDSAIAERFLELRGVDRAEAKHCRARAGEVDHGRLEADLARTAVEDRKVVDGGKLGRDVGGGSRRDATASVCARRRERSPEGLDQRARDGGALARARLPWCVRQRSRRRRRCGAGG